MIARIWRGEVPAAKADEYFELMRRVAIPDYRSCAGNLGAACLRRDIEDRTIVTMITYWSGLDAIRAFAGEQVEMAKYYDFDAQFLLDQPAFVEHHEVSSHDLL